MKKIFVLVCQFIFFFNNLWSFEDLTHEALDRIIKEAKVDSNLSKSIAHYGIAKIKNNPKIDPRFLNVDYKINVGKVMDQASSGRCWIFSLEKILSKELRSIWGDDFSFSHSFIAFWDQLERSNFIMNASMQAAIHHKPLNDPNLKAILNLSGDGGEWIFVKNIVEKYGLVPNQSMPETKFSGNTAGYMKTIKEQVTQCSIYLYHHFDDYEYKEKCLSNIYKILVSYLGEPPQNVLWPIGQSNTIYEFLTPKDFLRMTKIDLDDYVHISHLPHHNENGLIYIPDVGNVMEGQRLKTVSVSMEILRNAFKESIIGGDAVGISTSIKGLNLDKNLFSISDDKTMQVLGLEPLNHCSKADGLLCGRDKIDHGMIGIGFRDGTLLNSKIQLPSEIIVPENAQGDLFLVQNSWGNKNSQLYMTDAWINRYVYSILVHRKYVSPRIYKKYINESAEDIIFSDATDPFALVTSSYMGQADFFSKRSPVSKPL